ncbi:MAG TPA: WD40 repeat domain-containing protein [Chthonomonadaceae bacterium]|nr:WD40 repeat domain-containing protein [Chthonomonadaceae bacterium]
MKPIGPLLAAGIALSLVVLIIGSGVHRTLAQRQPPLKLPSSPTRSLQGHDVIAYVAYSPDGKMLATASYDKTAKIWNPATGQVLFTLTGHTDGLYSLAFSPDSKLLATSGSDGTTRLWDTTNGHCQSVIQAGKIYVHAVAFSPDGSLLATGGMDSIKIWDVATRKLKQTLLVPHAILSLVFSPDGKLLASCGFENTVILWNTSTWHSDRTISPSDTDGIYALAYSPDGKLLAGGDNDTTAKVWNPTTGKQIYVLKGHWGGVLAVAFSPDSKTLATGGDFSIKFWDMATGQNIGTIKPKDRDPKHDDPGIGTMVYSLAFSPDGSTLAVGAYDGIVDLWAIPKR